MIYADIIVDISHESIDRVFQYAVPNRLENSALIGVRVNIPFGRGNKIITGYIVGLGYEPQYDPDKIKYIYSIADNSVAIESQLISLAYFIKENFGGTINDALKVVIPVKNTVKYKEKKYIKLLVDTEELDKLIEINKKKNNNARVRFLEAFCVDNKVFDYDVFIKKYNISRPVIKFFEESGIVKVEVEKIYRNPIVSDILEEKKIILNNEQQYIVDDFWKDFTNGLNGTYFIHGVTGSGKTEVYIEIIKKVIANKKQVIVLIPEIALTYQTMMRFYRVFGDKVSIMNSRMSYGERYDQYLRAKNGDIDIMIGPRSALFTPFSNLGLIIMDEEHEGSYKSDSVPKYHAREVAIERARLTGASVILGSATPSLEAYYKALNKEYKLYKLVNRANDAILPKVWVCDMREELRAKNKSILSRRLYALMEDRLNKKEQIILFINRRGYSGFVSCRSCGHVMKCPHCDISLTYHRTSFNSNYGDKGKLVCHYCGYEQANAEKCPECSSDFIALFGTGTQKIEEMVNNIFPTARVLRMDADTTSGKQGHENVLSKFAKGEADIMIGTQMIVKGHDFPNVTLVGIIAADLSLNTNDYRAAERTYQLITQAAGRAGRGNKEGEVVIQTYRPEHYSIEAASKGNYEQFYDKEILYRDLLKYPPVADIMVVLMVSKDEELLDGLSKEYLNKVNSFIGDNVNSKCIGPVNATLSKANDMYRKVIYVKSGDYSILRRTKNYMEGWFRNNSEYRKCNIYYDFNPLNGY